MDHLRLECFILCIHFLCLPFVEAIFMDSQKIFMCSNEKTGFSCKSRLGGYKNGLGQWGQGYGKYVLYITHCIVYVSVYHMNISTIYSEIYLLDKFWDNRTNSLH